MNPKQNQQQVKQQQNATPFIRINVIESRRPEEQSPQQKINQEEQKQYISVAYDHSGSSLMIPDAQTGRDVNEFMQAWKSQIGISTLIAQKIVAFVKEYYKILPEYSKRVQEIQTLVIYNKSLLQILGKFEDYEKRILTKLKTMQELNIKVMRELCSMKNKPFKAPEPKNHESIFAKFSLKDMKLEPFLKEPQKIQEPFKTKLKKIFVKNLLPKNLSINPQISKKIEEYQNVKSKSVYIASCLQDLKQVTERIRLYNIEVNKVTYQNMFELFDMKQRIKDDLKDLQINVNNSDFQVTQEQQKDFFLEMVKIQADLEKPNQNQFLFLLRCERYKRNMMKQQRMKIHSSFYNWYLDIQFRYNQQTKQILSNKQKIRQLQEEILKMKAQKELKSMKQRSANKSSLEDSFMTDDARSHKNLIKQTQKTIQNQLKRYKQQNEKLLKELQQINTRQQTLNMIIRQMKQKINNLKILKINSASSNQSFIQSLFNKLIDLSKNINHSQINDNKQEQLESPKLTDHFLSFPDTNNQAERFLNLNVIHEKSEFDDLEAVQREVLQLRKKCEDLNVQIQKKDLQIVNLNKIISMSKSSNSVIQKIISQYGQNQSKLKGLDFDNSYYQNKIKITQKFNQKLLKIIQKQFSMQNLMKQKNSKNAQLITSTLKFQKNQYKQQLAKEDEIYEQNRQISEKSLSRFATNLNDQSHMSHKSVMIKSKSPRQQRRKDGPKRMMSMNQVCKVSPVLEHQNQKPRTSKRIDKIGQKYPKKVMFQQIPSPRSGSRDTRRMEQASFDSDRRKSSQDVSKMQKKSQNLLGGDLTEKQKSGGSHSSIKDGSNNHHQSEHDPTQTDNLLGFLSHNNINNQSLNQEKSMKIQQERRNSIDISKMSSFKDNIFSKPLNSKQDVLSPNTDEGGKHLQKTAKYGTNEDQQQKLRKMQQMDMIQFSGKLVLEKKNKSMIEVEQKNKLKLSKKRSQDNYGSINQNVGKLDVSQTDSYDNLQISGRREKQKQNEMRQSGTLQNQRQPSSPRSPTLNKGNNSNSNGDLSHPLIRINSVSSRPSQIGDKVKINSQNKMKQQLKEQKQQKSQEDINFSYTQTEYRNSKDGLFSKKVSLNLKKIAIKHQNEHSHTASINNYSYSSKLPHAEYDEPQYEQKILSLMNNNNENADYLDFYELYQRYKTVLTCLSATEQALKRHQLRYQKFVRGLHAKNKNDEQKMNVEEELWYLHKLVGEQKIRIQEQDRKFSESIQKQRKNTQILMNKQLKLLRQQHFGLKQTTKKFQ